MRLTHNIASLDIFRFYNRSLSRQSESLERVSSGLKVNSAHDDPNAIAESEKMKMEILGNNIASRNAQDGVSMLQTAEGGLNNMTSALQRVRELTIQYGSGANSDADKTIIKDEIAQLLKGYDQTCDDTEFNGVELLSKDVTCEMQIGARPGDSVEIKLCDLSSKDLDYLKDPTKKEIDDLDGTLSKIDDLLSTVINTRGEYGALENRLESSFNKTNEITQKMTNSLSAISDADIGEEMMNYIKDDILVQAGNAMMAQSNKFPQEILRILDNIR